ncbi:hypothetical protein VNO78_02492 [Psophocarpus tetragonolobus]|uniref:Wall-associated receptor kinase C-terminal domain-containing protein n=1 Tax=Psophocarpus tetragonolobus TaxID=3891 RepID=A0AAN9T2N4_PSOTE
MKGKDWFDEDEELGLARKNCKEGEANVTVEDVRGGVGDALKRGFWVLWNATNCNECETSGGRCGFDNDYLVYAFRCYCPDRPHALRCSSGSSTFPISLF